MVTKLHGMIAGLVLLLSSNSAMAFEATGNVRKFLPHEGAFPSMTEYRIEAGDWVSRNSQHCQRSIVPVVMKLFSINAVQALNACYDKVVEHSPDVQSIHQINVGETIWFPSDGIPEKEVEAHLRMRSELFSRLDNELELPYEVRMLNEAMQMVFDKLEEIEGGTIGEQQLGVEEIKKIVSDMIAAANEADVSPTEVAPVMAAVEAKLTEALGLNTDEILKVRTYTGEKFDELSARLDQMAQEVVAANAKATEAANSARLAVTTAEDAVNIAIEGAGIANETAEEALREAEAATDAVGEINQTVAGLATMQTDLSNEVGKQAADIAANTVKIAELPSGAEVDRKIAEATAGFVNQATLGEAVEAGLGEAGLASQAEVGRKIAEATAGFATKVDVNEAVQGLATQDDVTNATAGLASESFVKNAVAGLATKGAVESNSKAIANLKMVVVAAVAVGCVMLLWLTGLTGWFSALALKLRRVKEDQSAIEKRQSVVETELKVVTNEVAAVRKVDFQFDDIFQRLFAGEDIGPDEKDVWMSGDGQQAWLRIKLEEQGLVRILSGVQNQTQLVKTENLKRVLMRAWNQDRVDIAMPMAAE